MKVIKVVRVVTRKVAMKVVMKVEVMIIAIEATNIGSLQGKDKEEVDQEQYLYFLLY